MEGKYEFIAIVDNKKEFLDENYEKICELLNAQSGTSFESAEDIGWLIQNFVALFVCKDDEDTIVGFATGGGKFGAVRPKVEVEPYSVFKYFGLPVGHRSNGIFAYFDKDDNGINYEFSVIEPLVCCLSCSDENGQMYKNIGKFLLEGISNYYVEKGFDALYTSVESQTYVNNLIRVIKDTDFEDEIDEDTTNLIKTYMNDQTQLIKYYSRNGFEVSENYYEAVRGRYASDKNMKSVPSDAHFDVTFRPFLIKKIGSGD